MRKNNNYIYKKIPKLCVLEFLKQKKRKKKRGWVGGGGEIKT